ncbi:hypothetical protein FE236_01105 [Mariprofundus erugo]|uniref:Uncharacterized protein n=1 Tax=Mariprofundus erugo TaxID=2528639 RepID=A0A5R9GR83_9PROT|nr:hypothetical protein [Mariprofundus erugo]TLS66767.1 hypothetical protein FEF65_09615 [Mariprofundus erugo]TLS78378.1 hypothetical protein FE236_01105 [Mariprofundus erugo]
MVISPTITPVAVADFSNLNQTQQQHINQSEQSRKATDTVQLSAQARQLASAELHNKPAANTEQVAPHQAADNEAAEKVADNEAAEQARPSNPVTRQPETTKIDLLA